MQDGDLAFTVTNVETVKTLGNQFTKKDAQGTFYVVTLKIENKGNKTATFDSSMAKVTDDQGREIKKGTWLAWTKFENEELWEEVKKGNFQGLSVGCRATVEEIE